MIDCRVGPAPKISVSLTVLLEEMPGLDAGTSYTARQGLFPHAILNGECAGFELLTEGTMRDLGRVWRCCSRLLRKREVWISRVVSFSHVLVARERRSNSEFLLLPIDVG